MTIFRRSPRQPLPWLVLALAALLAGCVPVAMTAAGVGGQALTSHHMGGTAYKTFPEAMPKVREAAAAGLFKMAIRLDRVEKVDLNELILARTAERSIEIELEPVTPRMTRMKVIVKKDAGLFLDGATAIEIINQTEKILSRP